MSKKIKELKLGDFERTGVPGSFGHYFRWRDKKIEVCLESCLNGYDVAIYDNYRELIGEKTCTNIKGMLDTQIAPGFSTKSGEAINKAIEIANKKVKEYYSKGRSKK